MEQLHVVDPLDGATRPVEVEFTGEPAQQGAFTVRAGRLRPSNEPVEVRHTRLQAGARVIDAEARAAVRLCRDLAALPYPPHLSRLVGHSTVGGDWCLVRTRRGEPLGRLADQLPLPENLLRSASNGLVEGLAFLSGAGLVHRALSDRTVLWDGAHIQIIDFADAVEAATARAGVAGEEPWSPPGALPPGVPADVRDDVYSVAALVFWLATGEAVGGPEAMRRRLGAHPWLLPLLDGAFEDDPRDRPTPTDLLARARIADPRPPWLRADLDQREALAQRRYRTLVADKRQAEGEFRRERADRRARAASGAGPWPGVPPARSAPGERRPGERGPEDHGSAGPRPGVPWTERPDPHRGSGRAGDPRTPDDRRIQAGSRAPGPPGAPGDRWEPARSEVRPKVGVLAVVLLAAGLVIMVAVAALVTR